MAITGPSDLPVVLKVGTEPIKKYVFTVFGYPSVNVELTDDQLETIIRTMGDWIAGYFPREQRLAVFNTQPLRSTYPLPKDAYWVQEVAWDPVTTRIDDIFGAESFLFCVAPNFKILAKDGSLQPIGDWKKTWKAKTPYGNKSLKIKQHLLTRDQLKAKIHYAGGLVEASDNHVVGVVCDKPSPFVKLDGIAWRELGELKIGDSLRGVGHSMSIQNIEKFASRDANFSIRSLGSGCYYGCTEGEPVLIH